MAWCYHLQTFLKKKVHLKKDQAAFFSQRVAQGGASLSMMPKPAISISLGKPKASTPSSKPGTSQPALKPTTNGFSIPPVKRSRLANDSDSEEDSAPKHEEVTGFDASTGGAIAGRPTAPKEELVIKNAGNSDWRRRGKGNNILPAEVQAQQNQQNGRVGSVVETDGVSKESGLHFAPSSEREPGNVPARTLQEASTPEVQPPKQMSEDEIALQALLNDGKREKVSKRVIEQKSQDSGAVFNEVDDYKADVASRPDSCTLDEYAAMPVEEFGMALLRGMGQKRRANGEIITFGSSEPPKAKENRGYLGIGAKGAPTDAEVELGAWGKTAMRKNKKGEGLYTPVLLRDKRTGETLTEEELEARKKESKDKKGEEDWRDRRDKNLKDRGREDYKDQKNGFSRDSTSKRDRSRSRDGERRRRDRDYDDSDDRDSRDRRKERHRDRGYGKDRYRDDDRYDSSSSRKSSHRERDGHDDRDKDRGYRDRHRSDDRDRNRRDRY